MCSEDSNKNDVKELLEWEFSLDSRDLRAHAWYHGRNITRQTAETLLENDGDFLVRDCSSTSNPGQTVLSCRWKNNNLHFLVHRDILQKDTIYEQLHYRFEFQSFETVSDLITYHVGSGMPISSTSGALIHFPRNRTKPISGSDSVSHGERNDYVSLQNTALPDSVPAFFYVDKVSTLERNKLVLNLVPPPGLLEELESIPPEIQKICNKFRKEENLKSCNGSMYDLASFESILLPTCDEDIRLNPSLLEIISTRLLETSDIVIARHLTKLDWEILSGTSIGTEEVITDDVGNNPRGLYPRYFHNSQHRWNNVIERSLTMSHFVVLTISLSEKPEETLNQWILVANELKSSFGNFFSFCSIMRGLLMPQITRADGKINWMRLRSDFTESTFTFETNLRSIFQGLVRGTESYPPNTGIPELLSGALIIEDVLELLPISCIAGEEDKLTFITGHLNDLRSLSKWEDIQKRNIDRHFSENIIEFEVDFVLADILRTELQLLLIWGKDYSETSLKSRCESFDKLLLDFGVTK